jgi:hypothetical protein
MRRVLAAPATELAQLNPIRRVAPRLVCLVIASLAVFASHRYRDADISASHFSLDYLRAITRKNPGPRHEADSKNSALGYVMASPFDIAEGSPNAAARVRL